MIYVLDAGALIAFLKNETGADIVRNTLLDQSNACLAHALNMCEVYYDVLREHGEPKAQAVIDGLLSLGIELRDDLDAEIWKEAGKLKAEYRRISLADCFCIVLANRLRAEVVTTDHHEFDALAESGVCRVRFIR